MEINTFIASNSKCFTLVDFGKFLSTSVKVLNYVVVILLIGKFFSKFKNILGKI